MHTLGAFVGTIHQARGKHVLKSRIVLHIQLKNILDPGFGEKKKAMWIVELWQPDYRVVRGVTV